MKEKSTPNPAPEENVAQEGAQGLKKEIEAAVEAMVNEHLQCALVGLLRGDEREAARGLAHYEYLKDLQGKADRPLRPREFMDYYCGDDACEHGKRLYENCERCLPPAPPPCAAPAEETSSGGERSTAGGAVGICCEQLRLSVSDGIIYEYPGLLHEWTFCPWCGGRLGGEGDSTSP